MVENWPEVVRAGAAGLRREATGTSDPELLALTRRADAYARTLPDPDRGPPAELAVVCPRLTSGGRTLRTVSTVMRFDSAVDVTASDLRVELLFPADDDSDAHLRQLVATQHRTWAGMSFAPRRRHVCRRRPTEVRMTTASLLREQIIDARGFFEATLADVTAEQAAWRRW